MGIRKNQATLTTAERASFVTAIKALKANGVYDEFVEQHLAAFLAGPNDPAHGGPAFLPWHREYLRRFERALQEIDPNVSLPYWDWTVDRTPTASLWGPDFMGGNGTGADQRVMDGPFAFATREFTLNVRDPGDTTPFLTRAFGAMGSLPTQQLDHHALEYTYDNEPTSPQAVALTIDAPGVAASIGQAGEVDVFSFVVSTTGNYTIETQGPTDVVLGLYGPNDMATLIAEDDDSGADAKPRINRNLTPGNDRG